MSRMLKINSRQGFVDVEIDSSEYNKILTSIEVQTDLIIGIIAVINELSIQTGKSTTHYRDMIVEALNEIGSEDFKPEKILKQNT